MLNELLDAILLTAVIPAAAYRMYVKTTGFSQHECLKRLAKPQTTEQHE
jgi:hypothetical protein